MNRTLLAKIVAATLALLGLDLVFTLQVAASGWRTAAVVAQALVGVGLVVVLGELLLGPWWRRRFGSAETIADAVFLRRLLNEIPQKELNLFTAGLELPSRPKKIEVVEALLPAIESGAVKLSDPIEAVTKDRLQQIARTLDVDLPPRATKSDIVERFVTRVRQGLQEIRPSEPFAAAPGAPPAATASAGPTPPAQPEPFGVPVAEASTRTTAPAKPGAKRPTADRPPPPTTLRDALEALGCKRRDRPDGETLVRAYRQKVEDLDRADPAELGEDFAELAEHKRNYLTEAFHAACAALNLDAEALLAAKPAEPERPSEVVRDNPELDDLFG